MKNKTLKFVTFALFSLVYTLPALAGNDPGFEGGPDEEDPDPTPIDNWVLLLILVGVAIGIYFIKRNRRKAIA